MIGIVDYGMGNLRSVQKALERLGEVCFLATQPEELDKADRIVLPGVGAFEDAITALKKSALDEAMTEKVRQGTPFLGICLGMQMLFERSYENGVFEGLGWFPGEVIRFDFSAMPSGAGDEKYSIPHMGWNQVTIEQPRHLFWQGVEPGTFFYFVHSYYVVPKDVSVVGCRTEYGTTFCSAITQDNIVATQFHPEKSQASGVQLLENFLRM